MESGTILEGVKDNVKNMDKYYRFYCFSKFSKLSLHNIV